MRLALRTAVVCAAVVALLWVSPGEAQHRFAAVARVCEQVRAELQAPGLSVAVGIDDALAWSAGFGVSDVEHDVPAHGDTVYRIASISKTFGATAVLQLADRGRVQLDDVITSYVPTFHHPVTLRQILTHTSGIRHYKPGEAISTVRYGSLADAIAIFKDDPLLFSPGTQVSYSSYAFNLLQGVVETASGLALEPYLIDHIFRPAGLVDTQFDFAERIVKRRAGTYEWKRGVLQNAPYVDNSIKWLGGGLLSSAEDLVRYNIALNKGTLVSAAGLALMNTRSTLNNGTLIDYSIGWEIDRDDKGNVYVDKYGSGTGVSSYLLRIPAKHFAVAVLVNVSHGNIKPFAQRIAAAMLSDQTPVSHVGDQ